MSSVWRHDSAGHNSIFVLLALEDSGRKRRGLLGRMLRAVGIAGILAHAVFPARALPEELPRDDVRISAELASMGTRGTTIARARERTMIILRADSGCAAWFEDSTPAAADVFQSLHYQLVEGTAESASTVHLRVGLNAELWKNPWAAMSFENSGKNSTIRLNTHGAFFKGVSPVIGLDPRRWLQPGVGHRVLRVASYSGDTLQAQVTILLHELGHIIGRIPEDSDSWDGRSGENTAEVLRHCKDEIGTMARKRKREGD
jgi:hypothetical protein